MKLDQDWREWEKEKKNLDRDNQHSNIIKIK